MRVPRRNGVTWAVAALLGTAPVLAGCTRAAPDPAAAPQHDGQGSASSRRAGAGLAAVRGGLSHRGGEGPVYYLALGDSLSRGIQPTGAGRDVPTSRGYPDRLAARLSGAITHLHLVKLGCSGETTSTMIHGGICRYPAGSQLSQAARFLRSHRGSTALVTIDIGANDPNSCVIGARPATIFSCLVGRVPQIERNLSTILATLRAAAGPRVLIVGMTCYVPELGLWRTGRTGREIGLVTDDFAAGVNRLLARRYRHFGARVADVFAAFRSTDFGAAARPGKTGRDGPPPPNVTTICSLTWMCAGPPRGPDEHANDAGYLAIARTFWRAITG